LQAGLQPGNRVLLRLGNSVHFPIAYLAAIRVGLIPVPTSAQLTEGEVTKLADEVTPALVIAEPGIALPRQALPRIEAAALPDLYDLPPAAVVRGDPERAAYIVFTSGTAGQPRAVTHAHRAIWARRMMWQGWYGLTPSDRLLHAGAFNWTYTLGTGLLDPWACGATALIPGPGVAPAQLPLLMKRHDATIFAAAPGVYRQMLRGPVPPLPKLRHGLSAGEKLPASLRAGWREATGTALHEAFGMSECSTFVSGSPARPAPDGTLGRPQQGRRVAVLGPEGAPVPLEVSGVLAVSRQDPGLMLGYWDKARAGPVAPEGDWFPTGDVMRMAADGALRFEGRNDDMLNAGGFRVSPLEIEAALTQHPEISECAAVERRVSEDTTVIALYFTADHDIADATLQRFAAERLARYKQPRHYQRLDALPKNPNGKLQRRALRDTLRT
jgi:acyl-coenzyme A synthetase/AMP-(fatty) acid ligase